MDIKSNVNSKKLLVFEAFSGIGAQKRALEQIKKIYHQNYEIIATSDWDICATISYAAIHYPKALLKTKKQTPKYEKEINKYLGNFSHSITGKIEVNFSYILKMDFKKRETYFLAHKIANNLGNITKITGSDILLKNNIDLITYSFPCQDLSVAGSFHGLNKGMEQSLNNRSALIWEIGRILKELKDLGHQPKFLLLENVLNLVSTRHNEQYIEWKKLLQSFGYQTKTFKINAKDCGLPQIRKRVYAISFLNSNYDLNDELEIMSDKFSPENINNLIEKLKKDNCISNLEMRDIIKEDYSQEKYRNEALQVRPNKTPSRKRMFLGNYILNDFDKYNYCRTITTKQDRHPNAGVINLKNTSLETNDEIKANYRFLTYREAYLFMGFTDKDVDNIFKYPFQNIKKYQQAGNSIAINAITLILKIIQDEFNE